MPTSRKAAKPPKRGNSSENAVVATAQAREKEKEKLDGAIITVIRASLHDADLTHKGLANCLGLTHRQVANMLSGRRAIHASEFAMIARALNISPLTMLERVLAWHG